jgi:hypothetical protein
VAEFQILLWQDIPSVVKAFADDGTPASRQLPDRFQQEIDRQAMKQGLAGSDDYLAEWHWSERQQRPGTPDVVLDAVVAELEQQLSERLQAERAG